MERRFVFIAQKTDGFGARCLALVNAMLLAERFGGRFGFRWEDKLRDGFLHSVHKARDIFSPVFIDGHYIEDEVEGIVLLRDSDFLRFSDIDFGRSGEEIPVEAPSRLSSEIFGLTNEEFFERQAAAFQSIRFHPRLEEIGRAALDLPLAQNTIALHLRAGDVVYGNVKFCSQTEVPRGVPYALALRLIMDAAAEQRHVLLFGQDARLCQGLAVLDHVTFVGDLVDNEWSSMEREFFEIKLMSRCDEAIGAHSAFLELACFVAGVRLVNIYERYSRAEIVELLRKTSLPSELEGAVSTEQKLFNHWMEMLFLFSDEELSMARLVQLANAMFELNRENGFVLVLVISVLLTAGRIAPVKKILELDIPQSSIDTRFPPFRAVIGQRLSAMLEERTEFERIKILLLYLLGQTSDAYEAQARRMARLMKDDARPVVRLLCLAVRNRRNWWLQKARSDALYLTVGSTDGEPS